MKEYTAKELQQLRQITSDTLAHFKTMLPKYEKEGLEQFKREVTFLITQAEEDIELIDKELAKR